MSTMLKNAKIKKSYDKFVNDDYLERSSRSIGNYTEFVPESEKKRREELFIEIIKKYD